MKFSKTIPLAGLMILSVILPSNPTSAQTNYQLSNPSQATDSGTLQSETKKITPLQEVRPVLTNQPLNNSPLQT
jgi:hypothetical protein